MRPRTLGIIGLGPLGQSLGRLAIQSGIPAVLGWAADGASRVAAVHDGAAHDAPHRAEDVAAAADVVVLALAATDAVAMLPRLAPRLRPHTLLTDTAAVKRPFVECVRELPCADRAAGSHVVGAAFEPRFASLRDVLVYVTPVPGAEGAAREITHFWSAVYGAAPVVIDVPSHDAQAALTQHLPLLAATALAAALREQLPSGAALSPTARQCTRPASRGADLADDAWANRAVLATALRGLATETMALVRMLEAESGVMLRERLDDVARWRAARGE